MGDACDIPNVTLYRVGVGRPLDKYLLPLAGAKVASRLRRQHSYMFKWSLFASYGALASLLSFGPHIPHLITLADQKLGNIPWFTRVVLRHVLGTADQVYAMDTYEAKSAVSLAKRTALVRSIGQGDAFANQLRVAYGNYLRMRIEQKNS
jgi:hypothetical protein